VRDHVSPQESTHRASYMSYRGLQQQGQLKTNFCKIFRIASIFDFFDSIDPERKPAVQIFCVAKFYSITSSARSRIDGGTARPSALAALRFTTISNLVGS
jgi:hypothetical protein